MAVLLAAFPATTATTATTAITATMVTTVTTATTATTATMAITAIIGPPTDPSTVVTSVTALSAAVLISLKKPLKNKPTDNITWHLRCSYLSKKAFENMVKRATEDKIEALTTLQYLDCV